MKPRFMTFSPTERLYQAARLALRRKPLDYLPELRAAVAECDEAIAERKALKKYIKAAREGTNDELEIDDYPVTSDGLPEGVWVSAWTWVPAFEDDE